jgi:5-methylcytosine-specific restriction endonuclease McrA
MKTETQRFLADIRKKAKKQERRKRKSAHQQPKTRQASSGDRFYLSRVWRSLRYLALKNAGGCCQCCGASASDGVQLHVDHIKPRSLFPKLELDLSNLQVLCADCNIGKGAWDSTDWREHWKSI